MKRFVGYARAGTHASRIGSKRPGEVAVRNCQPVKGVTFFMSSPGIAVHVRRVHRLHEQVWFPRFGGKNGRVPRTVPQQISFNATRAGKNSSTGRIYHTRRKVIKEVTSWIEH